MQCVYPLAAGCAGCESGHAEIYQRGTANRSGYYTNAEGTGGTSTANVTLDANGAAEIYVNEHVDVKLYDSSATPVFVREFTVMNTDRNTEVISQSFTGQAYAGGGSAASLPVDLQTVLDLWLASAGTLDFQVDLDGTGTNLDTAIGAVHGSFYNVKAYGATGDGATDDRSAILAAKTAAAAVGGTVFFPAGTYKCASSVTWQDTNIYAVPGKADVTTSDWAFESSDGNRFMVRGLKFNQITVTVEQDSGPVEVEFVGCEFVQTTTTSALSADTDSTSTMNVYLVGCYLTMGSNASAPLIYSALNVGHIHMYRCVVAAAATWGSADYVVEGNRFKIRDMMVDMSAHATNSATIFRPQKFSSVETDIEVDGVYVTDNAGGGLTSLYQLSWSGTADCRFIERNSYVDPDLALATGFYSGTIAFPALSAVTGSKHIYGSREGRVYYESGTIAGTDTLPEQVEYELIWYNKTDTGALTIDLDENPPPPGSRTVIVVVNASGGTPTLDVSGVDVGDNSSHAMTATRKTIYYVTHFATDGVVVHAVQDIA